MSDVSLAHLPPAVRAQAERANAIHANVYTKENPGDAASEVAPETPAAPEAQPAAQPGPSEVPSFAQGGQPAPAPAPGQAPVSEPDWKHRYEAMRGRYEREASAVLELQATIASLQQDIRQLKMAGATPPSAAPPPELRAERLITPEEETEWTPQLLDVVGRKAKEVLNPIVEAKLREQQEEIARLKSQVGSVAETTVAQARQRMHAELDDKLPQWRQMNENNDFLAWLALPDRYSGAIRHDMLKDAYSRNQTGRVLAFFNGFLAEEAAVRPATPPADPSRQPTVDMVSLAAPGRAATTAAPAPVDNKPIITRAQIAAFYREVNRGAYRGREAEQQAAEKMIFEAEREGRIR